MITESDKWYQRVKIEECDGERWGGVSATAETGRIGTSPWHYLPGKRIAGQSSEARMALVWQKNRSICGCNSRKRMSRIGRSWGQRLPRGPDHERSYPSWEGVCLFSKSTEKPFGDLKQETDVIWFSFLKTHSGCWVENGLVDTGKKQLSGYRWEDKVLG